MFNRQAKTHCNECGNITTIRRERTLDMTPTVMFCISIIILLILALATRI